MCKDWDTVKDTTKSLEHIIMKFYPPTLAMQQWQQVQQYWDYIPI